MSRSSAESGVYISPPRPPLASTTTSRVFRIVAPVIDDVGVRYTLCPQKPLGQTFHQYTTAKGLHHNALQFYYHDQMVSHTSTPDGIHLGHDDIICALPRFPVVDPLNYSRSHLDFRFTNLRTVPTIVRCRVATTERVKYMCQLWAAYVHCDADDITLVHDGVELHNAAIIGDTFVKAGDTVYVLPKTDR